MGNMYLLLEQYDNAKKCFEQSIKSSDTEITPTKGISYAFLRFF